MFSSKRGRFARVGCVKLIPKGRQRECSNWSHGYDVGEDLFGILGQRLVQSRFNVRGTLSPSPECVDLPFHHDHEDTDLKCVPDCGGSTV